LSKHGGNWEEEQVPSELAHLLVDGWIDLSAWQQEKKTGASRWWRIRMMCSSWNKSSFLSAVFVSSSRARLQSFPVMYPGRCKLSWMVFLLSKTGT
jgi:hypothetical protein